MFTFDPDYQFRWPVAFKMPLDGGTWGERGFTATFKYMAGPLLGAALKDAETDPEKLRDLMKKVMVAVEGVEGPKSRQLKSSPALISQLLDVPAILNAAFLAYIKALSGLAEKN